MYTIQERVRIVILMAKYESVTAVKRQLTKEGFQLIKQFVFCTRNFWRQVLLKTRCDQGDQIHQ